jgi:hypothetical protein
MLRRIHRGLYAIVIVMFAGCGGGSEPSSGQATPAPAATAAPTDTADGPGVITGIMTFEGTPPPAARLRMDSDARCTPEGGATSELLVVGPDNGLQNVFVYVKDGLGARTYSTPTTPVMLDQKGCRYVPHVIGVQVGQPVQISNSDPTLHNVNSAPKDNRGFNFGQVPSTPPVTRMFDKPEVLVPFRCDVHSWMNAHAGVVAHPFFAVTKPDGSFEIKGLPPGTYMIEAVHERLGRHTQSVTVDGKTPAKITAAFKATT